MREAGPFLRACNIYVRIIPPRGNVHTLTMTHARHIQWAQRTTFSAMEKENETA